MLKTLFLIFIAYLLYKFIFGFVIPVYNGTKQVRKQMNNVQEQMRRAYQEQQQAAQQQQQYQERQQQSHVQNRPSEKGDYIDFEEVK
ncbi:uncharacterized protein DUF4834 [Chitinophaga skermanii]|uniref:Uncharacterized protein DUF4834 n=1 Tax=Chitinophaga skermanii TaxID=331697 RepID=A0A327QBE7_9BACT|nr:DUF4834 family protein [Chitinophaga skermanii]RAJ01601.1 uncharacterized protein DUF4834 [Chitinophaga skermanii]